MADHVDKRPRLDQSQDAATMSQASSSNAGPTAATKPHSSRSEHRRRFECTYAGCGRHYSRAEHLYRHQLNRVLHLLTLVHLP